MHLIMYLRNEDFILGQKLFMLFVPFSFGHEILDGFLRFLKADVKTEPKHTNYFCSTKEALRFLNSTSVRKRFSNYGNFEWVDLLRWAFLW